MKLPASPPGGRSRRSTRAPAATASLLLAALLASACGASPGHGTTSAPSRGTSAPSPTPVADGGGTAGAPCVTRPGSVCLTETARGHTVQLAVGWTLTLRLGAPGRRFSAPRLSGGNALRGLGPARRNGTEVIASFRAVSAGTVQLMATEGPVCHRGSACPDYLALWTLSVRVSRRL